VKKVTKPAAAATAKKDEELPWRAKDAAKTSEGASGWAPTDPATGKAKAPSKTTAAPSPCKGLDKASCGGNKACSWIVPKDANDKTGKVQDPYCRKVAGVVAVKNPMTKPAAAKVATPAAVVTKAATPPAGAAAAATEGAPAAAEKPMKKAVVKPAAAAAPAAKPVAPPAPAQ
jgi:hypothetical protein